MERFELLSTARRVRSHSQQNTNDLLSDFNSFSSRHCFSRTMKPVRQNTLVVDTSIFAKRPSAAEIKEFFDKKLQLDMTNVKRIQLHNIKNVVYLGMRDMAVANRIAADHHLKHYMVIDGKEVPIPVPVYIESNATDVRLHDLPEEIDTQTIIDHMTQYGEVISIREELWKNFWPGFFNGVVVCRMRLARHIPSFINFPEFDEAATLVSYKTQIRTCVRCNRKAHPKLRCSDAAAAEKQNPPSNQQTDATVPTQTNNSNIQLASKANNANENDRRLPTPSSNTSNQQAFPALPVISGPSTAEPENVAAATKELNSNNANKMRVKRQHTIEHDTANKKQSGSDSAVNPLLDQQAVFDELMRSDRYTCHTDPDERKRVVWKIAAEHVEINRRNLMRQKK